MKTMKKLIVLLAGLALASAALARVDPKRPMITGKGNVTARPVKVIVTNQTAANPDSDNTVVLESITVTGSILHAPAKTKVTPPAQR
jgi:uncharacterized lipoprotein